MFRGFSTQDGEILEELLAETAGGLFIKTDSSGFIEQASEAIEALGLRLSEMLFRPHLADLTSACHAEAVRAYHRDALAGVSPIKRLEFPLTFGGAEKPAWYALSLRPFKTDNGECKGALGLLRSIESRRSLEDELTTASMTDSATGLANGQAFRAMLSHLLRHESSGAVAILEVDRCSAMKLRFGHAMTTEMLWAFGRFLGNVLPPEFVLARLDGDRFAVLMPELSGATALAHIQEVLRTFAELSGQSASPEMRMTASAGMAPLSGNADDVLIQAERALVVARALGGHRAELRGEIPRWNAGQHL